MARKNKLFLGFRFLFCLDFLNKNACKHSHLRLSSFVKKPNPIDCNGFSQYLKLQRRHLIHIEEFCPHPDTVDQKFFQLKKMQNI